VAKAIYRIDLNLTFDPAPVKDVMDWFYTRKAKERLNNLGLKYVGKIHNIVTHFSNTDDLEDTIYPFIHSTKAYVSIN
jgi:hypothetical protein